MVVSKIFSALSRTTMKKHVCRILDFTDSLLKAQICSTKLSPNICEICAICER